MTVPNTTDRNSFSGNGSQTIFSFTFRTVASEHVKVYVNGVLQSTSTYTVKIDASGVGGTVTFNAAPANGAVVLLLRESDLLQLDHFEANDTLPPATLERMIDKLAIIAQQFNLQLATAVRLAASVDPESVSTILPDWESGKLIGWNTDSGDKGLRNVDPLAALNDALPGGGAGNVVGPASTLNQALAVWDSVNRLLKVGPLPGAVDNVVKSNGTTWISGPVPSTPPPEPFVEPSGKVAFFLREADVPAGWVIMEGQTVTINSASVVLPDARGKYLMIAARNDTGLTNAYTGSTVRPGQISGNTLHTHTQQGSFATDLQDPGSSTTIGYAGGGNFQGIKTSASLSHNHSVTISGPTAFESDRQRCLALIAAIKVDE